ncbi:hypothetical protein CgunFtcFv8_010070 [Champsocephalus gunnari]|uniref:Stress-associated endoplasmic reticulum protein n=1 Tax=Champsocephalus gunnari TaxID=52237 RepID=A0AAN8HUV0_CHAGU|nr:hypothetical protein CgunFtcFv8_010070 [Champsocephalus gunnari]
MVAKQRIRMANEKHSKNITLRGERGQIQQEHPGGEGRGTLAARALHLRRLWISHLPDHPEHQDGHVVMMSSESAPPDLDQPPRHS